MSLKDSLAAQLLKIIFGLYFLVTVVVTSVQLTLEYNHAKQEIQQELRTLPSTFGPGMTTAVWGYNDEILHSILVGMYRIPIVVGVQVKDLDGNRLQGIGRIIDDAGRNLEIHESSGVVVVAKKQSHIFDKLYDYQFPINYTNDNGEIEKIGTGVIYSSTELIVERVEFGFFLILANSIVKTVALWIIFLLIMRKLVGRPLKHFIRAIDKIKFHGLSTAELNLPITRQNELKFLETSFNRMLKDLAKSRADLERLNQTLEQKVIERTQELQDSLDVQKALSRELTAKNEEMERDLIMAQKVQQHVLTQYKEPENIDIAVRYLPHAHVSGDVYYLEEMVNGECNIFLGDGTGHGVAAALTTVMAEMILSERSQDPSIVSIMKNLNQYFYKYLSNERFMSGVFIRISPDGEAKMVNAGHLPLLIVHSDDRPPTLVKDKGILLGVISEDMIKYYQSTFTFKPGDTGLIFTDGITERKSPEGELFGLPRLCNFLTSHRSENLDDLLSHLLAHLDEFAQGTAPEDDVTVVGFQYRL